MTRAASKTRIVCSEVMDCERERTGKAIILVGDLNICRRAEDQDWGSRMVDVDSFIAVQPAHPMLQTLHKDLVEIWPGIKEKLEVRQEYSCRSSGVTARKGLRIIHFAPELNYDAIWS